MSQGFNASCYQIRIGYKHFRGKEQPGNMSYADAANGLVRDFGLSRVRTVLTAIPNNTGVSDFEAWAAAVKADPGPEVVTDHFDDLWSARWER